MNGLLSMIIFFPVIWWAKSIEWTSQRVIIVQIGFLVVQFLTISTLLYIYRIINKKADAKMIDVPIPPSSLFTPSTGTERMSVKDYDLKEWKQLFFQGTLVQLGILIFISVKFNAIIPLLSQIYMSPLRIWNQNLFQSHILNRQIPRPFPQQPSLLSSLFPSSSQPTPSVASSRPKKD